MFNYFVTRWRSGYSHVGDTPGAISSKVEELIEGMGPCGQKPVHWYRYFPGQSLAVFIFRYDVKTSASSRSVIYAHGLILSGVVDSADLKKAVRAAYDRSYGPEPLPLLEAIVSKAEKTSKEEGRGILERMKITDLGGLDIQAYSVDVKSADKRSQDLAGVRSQGVERERLPAGHGTPVGALEEDGGSQSNSLQQRNSSSAGQESGPLGSLELRDSRANSDDLKVEGLDSKKIGGPGLEREEHQAGHGVLARAIVRDVLLSSVFVFLLLAASYLIQDSMVEKKIDSMVEKKISDEVDRVLSVKGLSVDAVLESKVDAALDADSPVLERLIAGMIEDQEFLGEVSGLVARQIKEGQAGREISEQMKSILGAELEEGGEVADLLARTLGPVRDDIGTSLQQIQSLGSEFDELRLRLEQAQEGAGREELPDDLDLRISQVVGERIAGRLEEVRSSILRSSTKSVNLICIKGVGRLLLSHDPLVEIVCSDKKNNFPQYLTLASDLGAEKKSVGVGGDIFAGNKFEIKASGGVSYQLEVVAVTTDKPVFVVTFLVIRQ